MMRTKAKNRLVVMALAIAAAAATTACSPTSERSEFFAVPPYGWPYGMEFAFTPVDSASTDTIVTLPYEPSQDVDLALVVRHANSYEYSNLWVEVSYTLDDSCRCDTFNVLLADEFGRWYGHGIGLGYQYVDTLYRNTPIDLSQPISVRHLMRVDTLRGIEQIGIITSY